MPNYPQFQYQVKTSPVFTEPVLSWHAPLSEPVRRRIAPALAVALAASGLTQCPGFIPPDIGVASGTWSQPPARIRQVQYQAQAFVSVVETITPDKWFAPWSDPPKPKAGLAVARQQFIAFVQAAPFPEATFESKWHYPWSEPVRVKPGLRAAAQQSFTSTTVTVFESVTLDKWYFAWPTPPKPKTSVTPASQQFIAFVKAAPFPEATFESKWHYAWSEPVRLKPGMRAAQQAFLFAPTFTSGESITLDKWYAALAEPVRVKPGLRAAAQSSFTTDLKPQVSFSWFQKLDEPSVKARSGLRASAQTFLALAPQPVVSFAWNQAQTDLAPRAKLGLLAAYQPFFTAPVRLLPTPSIIGVLAATETNDTLLFGGIRFNAPVSALAGVIELAFTPMLSVVEQPLRATMVSAVIEDAVAPASGSAVPGVASAAVSIRII